ncbi:hypothetical protein Mapa_001510 [Marchantia paleacea]|nr:hypothetical protein Mapa_001510 [Marchantia paleacea]
MDDDEGRDDEVEKFHVSKRARYNKTSVVVFDDEARKEFLTGFRKRKNKRRLIAAEQNQIKERQKRLQDRKERRQALKEAKEEASKGQGREEDGGADAEEEEDDESSEETTIGGTVTYDDRGTRTVVNITPINPEIDDDDDDEDKEVRTSGACVDAPALKVKKPKFKKPKKPQSEKRTRKLSRREKSVPRNLRTKKRKKK